MEIRSSFGVPLPVDAAWTVLLDAPRIAPCMPGARLVEILGPNHYSGEVAVKLGPIAVKFAGRVEIVEIDPATFRARMVAQGNDTKGRGGAAADVRFALSQEGENTQVTIATDLRLSGSIAQYGRASGMVNDLANHIVGQFAANLRRQLDQERQSDAHSTPAAAPKPQARRAAVSPVPLHAGRLGWVLLWNAIKRFSRRLLGHSE